MSEADQITNEILQNKEIMSALRAYLWDGFAAHNVADIYLKFTKKRGFDHLNGHDWESMWGQVRDKIKGKVKELTEKHGEFGQIS